MLLLPIYLPYSCLCILTGSKIMRFTLFFVFAAFVHVFFYFTFSLSFAIPQCVALSISLGTASSHFMPFSLRFPMRSHVTHKKSYYVQYSLHILVLSSSSSSSFFLHTTYLFFQYRFLQSFMAKGRFAAKNMKTIYTSNVLLM